MPTYQYVCTECGGQLEAVQKFTDEPLTTHQDCGGRLRKVFSPVGIVFKGSGFYRTDSRGSGSSGGTSAPAKETSPDSSSKPGDKGDKTAAAAGSATEKSSSDKSSSSSSSEKVA